MSKALNWIQHIYDYHPDLREYGNYIKIANDSNQLPGTIAENSRWFMSSPLVSSSSSAQMKYFRIGSKLYEIVENLLYPPEKMSRTLE